MLEGALYTAIKRCVLINNKQRNWKGVEGEFTRRIRGHRSLHTVGVWVRVESENHKSEVRSQKMENEKRHATSRVPSEAHLGPKHLSRSCRSTFGCTSPVAVPEHLSRRGTSRAGAPSAIRRRSRVRRVLSCRSTFSCSSPFTRTTRSLVPEHRLFVAGRSAGSRLVPKHLRLYVAGRSAGAPLVPEHLRLYVAGTHTYVGDIQFSRVWLDSEAQTRGSSVVVVRAAPSCAWCMSPLPRCICMQAWKGSKECSSNSEVRALRAACSCLSRLAVIVAPCCAFMSLARFGFVGTRSSCLSRAPCRPYA